MADEGSEREYGGLGSLDSIESRWVFQYEEDESEIYNDGTDAGKRGDDLLSQNRMDSDDEDNAKQRLIRTGSRIHSFNVEALEVPGVQMNDFEDATVVRKIALAFQMLGVVFGDVGTSPLYTFSVMFSKSPVTGMKMFLGHYHWSCIRCFCFHWLSMSLLF